MKDVEAIICNTQDWLESAIRLVNNIEVFIKAILKFLWCASIFLNVTNFQINEHWLVMMEIRRFGRAMECKCMEEIHSLLRMCTQQDYASLRLKVTEFAKRYTIFKSTRYCYYSLEVHEHVWFANYKTKRTCIWLIYWNYKFNYGSWSEVVKEKLYTKILLKGF